MVRNAGGRAFDAIRTLAVLQTIGNPDTIVVMHHSGEWKFGRCQITQKAIAQANWAYHLELTWSACADCGMSHFHDSTIREALVEIAPHEKPLIESMKFGEIFEYVGFCGSFSLSSLTRIIVFERLSKKMLHLSRPRL